MQATVIYVIQPVNHHVTVVTEVLIILPVLLLEEYTMKC